MNLFENNLEPKLTAKIPNKIGYSYSYNKEKNLFFIKVPNGELIYSENYFEKKISDRSIDFFFENENGLNWKNTDWRDYEKEKLLEIKFTNILWQHDQVKMFGKQVFGGKKVILFRAFTN